MTVEAQLCPQCGAAVQFGEGQTEVVCSHCGTTVVKAAASGATSVEKELADEKLVQETVGRERKLHAHGRPATAKIVSAQATDIFRPTVEGRAVLMSFAVEVQPDGETPFAAEAKVLVGLSAVDKYRPGTLLDVRYDPQNRAQVSIQGRHGVKSMEERSRERQAKEQARWKEKQAQRVEPAGSVPVPVEFAQVTSLGPAAAVHEHQGLRLLSNFGTPRPNVLVRYRDGLAYRTHGPEVTTWRWDEAAVIQSNVSDHLGQHSATVALTEHEYTLTKHSGEKLILDDGLKDIGPLIASVKEAVFALIGPPLAQRYQAGEALTFGPVTIQRQNGLQLDGKPYAWDAIQDVKVDNGLLKVTLRIGQKGQPVGQARVSAIPNVELLCQLIGVRLLSSGDLAHLV